MMSNFVLLAFSNPLDHIVQHPLVTIDVGKSLLTPDGKFTLMSDQIIMLITAGVLLIGVLPRLVKAYGSGDSVESLVPRGFLNAIEAVCEYLRKEVVQPALHEHTDRFVKYVWTIFFFILTINILGLLPISSISALFGTHIGGTATANIYLTGTMAVLTMFMMVFNGLRLGGKAYLAHFCPGPILLAPLLIPVEIMGLGAKVFALAVRLFANMMAGHVLLAVLIGFILSAWASMGAGGGLLIAIPVVIGSVAITLLEVFVAFLQAFIFTFLTTLFIGMSVVLHHD